MEPISSRTRVPPSANSKMPRRNDVAPVNAPFSDPNSSASMRLSGKAAQFVVKKSFLGRLLL